MKNIKYNGNLLADVEIVKRKTSLVKTLTISSAAAIGTLTISVVIVGLLGMPIETITMNLTNAINDLVIAIPAISISAKAGSELRRKTTKKKLSKFVNDLNIRQGMCLSRDSFEYCTVKKESCMGINSTVKNATFYMLDNEKKLCVLKEYRIRLLNEKEKSSYVRLLNEDEYRIDEISEAIQTEALEKVKVKTL